MSDTLTEWTPERKVVAAAIAGFVMGAVQWFTGQDLWPGAEAGLAVIVAYLIPNR
jgi:hypothetical protein